MDFTAPPKRKPEASIIPMINVVFLLLIFFLMTSQITPPEPFEVTLPQADVLAESAADLTIHVSKTGEVQFEELTDDAAFQRLAGRMETKVALRLRVDAELPATKLAQIMARLSMTGATAVEIVATDK